MATILEFRPTCINKGCKKPVTWSFKQEDGTHRWKPICSHCEKAQQGRKPYASGVTPYRSGICENKDSRLGFKCAVNHKLLPKGMHITEIDHKNGDHTDNRLSNIQELCVVCHKIKSRLSGDLNRWKNYAA
jgi:carbonic anhydrase